jgi:hypothetical protein
MSEASKALEIIRSVAQTMQETASTQPALEAVVKLISEKMQVDVCSIYLYQGEANRLHLGASWGLIREGVDEVAMTPGEGLTGYVFSHGEIVNIANPREDARNKYFPGVGEDCACEARDDNIPDQLRKTPRVHITPTCSIRPRSRSASGKVVHENGGRPTTP